MTLVITVVFGEMHRNLIYLIKLSQKINLIKIFTYTTSTMLFFPPVFIISPGHSTFSTLAILINCFAATKCMRYIHLIATAYASEDLSGIVGRFELQ